MAANCAGLIKATKQEMIDCLGFKPESKKDDNHRIINLNGFKVFSGYTWHINKESFWELKDPMIEIKKCAECTAETLIDHFIKNGKFEGVRIIKANQNPLTQIYNQYKEWVSSEEFILLIINRIDSNELRKVIESNEVYILIDFLDVRIYSSALELFEANELLLTKFYYL